LLANPEGNPSAVFPPRRISPPHPTRRHLSSDFAFKPILLSRRSDQMTNQTNDAAPSWHLTDYNDFNELDANFSGVRFTQGIVWNPDANEWVSTWQFGMARLTPDFKFLQTTGSYDLSTFEPISAIPKALADMGLDHIGDIDYANGKLYVALDNSEVDYTTGYVAVFNASDLSYTGQVYSLVGAPSNPHNDVASWVAVDADAGLGFGKEYKSGNTINVYNLSDWSFKTTITMDMNLDHIQGAKVLDGMMYMSSDNNTQSIYSLDMATGHVTELFRLPSPGNVETEVEGIEARKNAEGNVELTVELIIEPHGDTVADDYVRVFTYTLDGTSADVTPHHTWTVNTAGDNTNANDLSLTLREAVAKAEAGDTITFDASLKGKTITLDDAVLALSKDVTIEGDLDGDGKSDITIHGGSDGDIIHVTGGKAVLDGLVITNQDGSDNGSVVADSGATLELTNGATMSLGTDGDDQMNGKSVWDVIRSGAGNDTVNGLGGNDELYGEDGNDRLVGGDGNDKMIGGAGDDTYVVSDKGDVVAEREDGGNDSVEASVNTTLSDNVENLTLTGSDDLDGSGNALANAITGNDGDNRLYGLDGNDTIKSGAGIDRLHGGNGNDILVAGGGSDAIHGDAGDDRINAGAGIDRIYGGLGRDVLTGGAGADFFIFAKGDSAADKGAADIIRDMNAAEGDRIDLHAIDANQGQKGDQAFHFIGSADFSGAAGELRFEKSHGDTFVFGDTDGDGNADFTLHLHGATALKGEYFIL
jgi:Ca2+-binding RTX toxin-like protein